MSYNFFQVLGFETLDHLVSLILQLVLFLFFLFLFFLSLVLNSLLFLLFLCLRLFFLLFLSLNLGKGLSLPLLLFFLGRFLHFLVLTGKSGDFSFWNLVGDLRHLILVSFLNFLFLFLSESLIQSLVHLLSINVSRGHMVALGKLEHLRWVWSFLGTVGLLHVLVETQELKL